MKLFLIPMIFFSLINSAYAERITDKIHSLSAGTKGQDHLLYLNSGRVIRVSPSTFSITDFESGQMIEAEVDEQNRLESISSLPDESLPQETLPEIETEFEFEHEATVLTSYAEANSIFRGMNRSYKKNTECTDRAHVWSYEEWKKHGLISRKVFMFFTNTYIRRYNYHWWFHVSPYTLVGNQEYIMDRKYTSAPRTRKTWSDIFIYSKRSCPVTTYAHYRRNKNGPEHCFHVKSSMYNRLPYHVRMQEDYGRVQTRFNTSEVNFSYRAFNRRGR